MNPEVLEANVVDLQDWKGNFLEYPVVNANLKNPEKIH